MTPGAFVFKQCFEMARVFGLFMLAKSMYEMPGLRRQGQTSAAPIIAAIEDKAVIEEILTHLENTASCTQTAPLPQARAPPEAGLFI